MMWEEGWCCTAGGKQGIFVLAERGQGQKLSSLLPPPGQHGEVEPGALSFTGELFLTILEKKCSPMDYEMTASLHGEAVAQQGEVWWE